MGAGRKNTLPVKSRFVFHRLKAVHLGPAIPCSSLFPGFNPPLRVPCPFQIEPGRPVAPPCARAGFACCPIYLSRRPLGAPSRAHIMGHLPNTGTRASVLNRLTLPSLSLGGPLAPACPVQTPSRLRPPSHGSPPRVPLPLPLRWPWPIFRQPRDEQCLQCERKPQRGLDADIRSRREEAHPEPHRPAQLS